MFERFTQRARQVVVFAQDEARELRHNYIGTEHLLLGLLREADGPAARVLDAFDVTVEEVRAQVARIVGHGDEVTTGQIPFTPRAKRVLELSLRESLSIGHNYIGTEHLLLGLAHENDGVAMRILLDFGIDPDTIRNEVLKVLSVPQAEADRILHYTPSSPPVAPEVIEKLDELQRDTEKALGAQSFEEAVRLKQRGQRLRRAARELERAMSDEPPLSESPPFPAQGAWTTTGGSALRPCRMPRRVAAYGSPAPSSLQPLLLGWSLFAVALGIGILIGWLIWG